MKIKIEIKIAPIEKGQVKTYRHVNLDLVVLVSSIFFSTMTIIKSISSSSFFIVFQTTY